MRTLFILPDLFRAEGGIARIMRLYLRAMSELAAEGDRIDYVALLDEGDTRAQAQRLLGARLGTIVNAGGNRFRFFLAAFRLAWGADQVICGHIFHLIIARMAALFRPSLRCYLVAHGIDVWRPYRLHEAFALRGVHRVFCISDFTRRQMLRFAPALPPHKLIVVPNTFDPEFAPSPANGTMPGAPVVLVVSRLTYNDRYKGVDLVIEALPRVRRDFPDIRLRIVGTGDDVPRLAALVERLGLRDAVSLVGAVDDATLRREYAACTLFALPSRKEGFGLVFLEAMAYGKPCIAARAGGAPEVVGDRDGAGPGSYVPGSSGSTEVGALVEFGNVEQLAEAIDDLLRHPRNPETVRARAAEYAFPAFKEKLAKALADDVPAPSA
jgi:glycosyltransferase involved in cell wall biosynthesis